MTDTVIEVVSDADDVRLDAYRHLTDVNLRKLREPPEGLFMAESQPVIARALTAGYVPRSILTTDRWLADVRGVVRDAPPRDNALAIYLVSDEVIRQVTGFRVHRGALAAMNRKPLPSVDDVIEGATRLLILEGIVDHTNVGAVFRSAAGLGFGGVLVDPTCADPLYRRSVRVSMGAVFDIPWTRLANWPADLHSLRAGGWHLMALTPSPQAEPIRAVAASRTPLVALLLGTEGRGLTQKVLPLVDRHVRIPMARGVDSLNIAAACAIACYALSDAVD
jgi:tRNA G18 (ribose-2'-O)-methylase SpoU